MVIHLKHNFKFIKGLIFNYDKNFWDIIARDYTQCWLKITNKTSYSTNINDVTCLDCLKNYEESK